MPPPLSDLYEDLLAQPGLPPSDLRSIAEHAANLVTLRYRNGADVQVLASKSSGRYRVQAATLEARALAAVDLRRRLARHFATNAGTPAPKEKGKGGADAHEEYDDDGGDDVSYRMWYASAVPLRDVLGAVDAHFAARVKVLQAH